MQYNKNTHTGKAVLRILGIAWRNIFGKDHFSKFQSGFTKMDSIIDFFLCNFPKISRTVIFDIVMRRNPSYETRVTYKDFSVQLGVYVKHKQIAYWMCNIIL